MTHPSTNIMLPTSGQRQSAARRAALFFFIAGVLAVVNSVLLPAAKSHQYIFIALGVLDIVIAAVMYLLPWSNWPTYALVIIIVLAFVVIGLFYYVGAAPLLIYPVFFMLLFIWIGLALPPWTSLMLTPLTVGSYIIPLLWPGAHVAPIDSAVVAVPVCILIGEVIARVMNRLRIAQEVLEQQVTNRTAELRATNMALQHELAERKQTETALRLSNERFQLVARATNDVIWDNDFAQQSVWWNDNVQTMFGYRADTIDQDFGWWRTQLHPDDQARVCESFDAALAHGEQFWSDEYRFRRSDGSYADVLERAYILYDATMQPSRGIGSLMDITARKQADATRVLLATIVDSSNDAIIGVALDGTVLSWNTGAAYLYGYRADRMIGQPIATMWPPQVQDEATQLNARLARGETTAHFETVRLRSDGQLIDVALTVSAITDASGAVSGFSTIARDISARKHADQALRQQTALIQLFQEVAAAANQATSLNQALQTAVDAICTHIGWPVGHVYLPDPAESAVLLPTSIWHLEDPQRFAAFRTMTEAVRLAPGIGLPGQVMASRKPAWIADMILDVTTPRTMILRAVGIRAGFALPVRFGDEVAAILEFFATESIEPDAALLDVLQHVSTQLGRVVERMRAETAVRESQERLTLLNTISAGIIAGLPTTDLIERMVMALGRTFPALRVSYATVDVQGWLTTRSVAQPRAMPDYADRAINLSAAPEYLHAVRTGEPISVEDTAQDPRLTLLADQLLAEGTRALLSVPVPYSDHKIGALAFHAPAPRCWNEHEAATLLSVAEYLAVALRNDDTQLERQRAEDALRAAEAQYRTLVEQIPAIIYRADLNDQSSTSYVSPQIEAMLGFSPEEWLADPDLWLTQVHPDDRADVLAAVERAQTSDAPVPLEYRTFTRDGRAVWLRDAARVVRDETGHPLFLQGITFDITDSKHAEDALRRSELRNRALINAMPDMMFRFDKAGVYLDCRANDTRDLVRLPADMLGKTIADVLPPDLTRVFMTGIDRALATGAAQLIEYQLMLNNSAQEFEARMVICGEDEVVAIVRNITERKQIERMKNEFVATVSHELRTPLTSIRGALGLIAGGVAGVIPPNVQRMVDIACTNSDRLIRLINDILDIEKIESGNLDFNLQPLALLPLVAQTIEATRAYGAQFNVTFAIEATAHECWVNVDSDRLTQALTNVLANAVKFSPPGDIVRVRVSRDMDMTQVAISDHGPGVPESFREQLFQKFAQADSSTTREKGGTGLGLSITRAIIERLGGQIAYAPNQGGATFVLDLPVWPLPMSDVADAQGLLLVEGRSE